MKRTSVGKNYIVNTIYQLIVVVIPLFTLPHLSRVLGAEGIGVYSFNNSIVSYFVLFAATGTGVFGQRELAYHQESKYQVSKIFLEVQILRTVLSVISAICYIIYVFYFGRDKTILFILLPSLLNVILDISWFWSGLEEFSKLAIRFICIKLLYLAFIFLCINSPDDILLYIAGEIVIASISYIALWPGLGKILVKVDKLAPFSHLKKVFILFLPSLAIQIYTVLDKTMLGAFSSGTYIENGYYEQAQGIIKSCMVIVTSLGTVMGPKISHFYSKGRKAEMLDYLYLSYRFMWFITIVLFVIIANTSSILIPLFLGNEFVRTAALVQICCPMFVIIGLSNVSGLQYFVPCDFIRQHTTSLIIGSIVNFLLNLWLIPRFQAVGASFASVIAELCVTTTQFLFIAKMGELRVGRILSFSIKYIGAGLLSGFSMLWLKSFLPATWGTVIELILLGLFVYLLFLIIFQDKLILDFIKMVMSKHRRSSSLLDD